MKADLKGTVSKTVCLSVRFPDFDEPEGYEVGLYIACLFNDAVRSSG
jgi:hypothetical protein